MTTDTTPAKRLTIPDGARWWTDTHGFLNLAILPDDARCGYHQGQCDDDIADLQRVDYLAAQLDALDPAAVRESLREYGAWDDDELASDADNRDRLLWLACGDVVEEMLTEEAYDERA